MPEQLYSYFKAEKSESLLFMLAGLLALAFSVYAWIALRQKFYTGIAIPFALIGVIQIIVGSTVFFRTDAQVKKLELQYAQSPAQLAADELPRMEKVMSSFTVIKYLEITFIALGIGLVLFLRSRDLWLGVGIGLLAQGALSLVMDLFAERRGETYIEAMKQIS